MRRSVQPSCPRAMTCCFFVSLKMLAMPAEEPRSLPPRQRLERLLLWPGFRRPSMAGFGCPPRSCTTRSRTLPLTLPSEVQAGPTKPNEIQLENSTPKARDRRGTPRFPGDSVRSCRFRRRVLKILVPRARPHLCPQVSDVAQRLGLSRNGWSLEVVHQPVKG